MAAHLALDGPTGTFDHVVVDFIDSMATQLAFLGFVLSLLMLNLLARGGDPRASEAPLDVVARVAAGNGREVFAGPDAPEGHRRPAAAAAAHPL